MRTNCISARFPTSRLTPRNGARDSATNSWSGRTAIAAGSRRTACILPVRRKFLTSACCTARLADKQVDLVAGNSTDGVIASLHMVVLEDDRHYFPAVRGRASGAPRDARKASRSARRNRRARRKNIRGRNAPDELRGRWRASRSRRCRSRVSQSKGIVSNPAMIEVPPGNANLPIGVTQFANRESGVPGEPALPLCCFGALTHIKDRENTENVAGVAPDKSSLLECGRMSNTILRLCWRGSRRDPRAVFPRT